MQVLASVCKCMQVFARVCKCLQMGASVCKIVLGFASVCKKIHKVFFIVRSKVVLFLFIKGFLNLLFGRYICFWCSLSELILDLMISKFFIYTKMKTTSPLPAIY